MNLDGFFLKLKRTKLARWESCFKKVVDSQLSGLHKESLDKWYAIIDAMPEINIKECMLSEEVVSAIFDGKLSDKVKQEIENGFRALNPWRKGPFNIAGVHIDSEWRSDMKWARLKGKIDPLKNKTVLDVGCGNGYHCFRAVGDGAEIVLGIDHKVTFFGQNQALLKYLRTDRTAVIPMGVDDIPDACRVFDTVLSMGVLYHVHSPEAHLKKLYSLLRKGGELVLETLVIDEEFGDALVPKDRYARMSNVRIVPSVGKVIKWMKDCGFDDVRLIDKTKTTTEEQHRTDWGVKQSLEDFLDPQDKNKTIEGYPAPQRAIFVAKI